MINLERIRKECFWDLNNSEKDIEDIINGSDIQYRKILFNKILVNSTMLLLDLQLFNKEEISKMLAVFIVPQFNGDYLARRKNIAEVYFLDKPLEIDELKWPA